MDSASFWITADLAGNAPDGSAIQLETTGLDGQKQNLELSTSAYKDGTRYNVSASVFSSEGMAQKEHFIPLLQEQKVTNRFTRSW